MSEHVALVEGARAERGDLREIVGNAVLVAEVLDALIGERNKLCPALVGVNGGVELGEEGLEGGVAVEDALLKCILKTPLEVHGLGVPVVGSGGNELFDHAVFVNGAGDIKKNIGNVEEGPGTVLLGFGVVG